MVNKCILYKKSENINKEEALRATNFIVDLNLNQIIDSITSGKDEYNLKPFYYSPLNEIDAINYRQEVMKDIENPSLFGEIKSFAEKMSTKRNFIAESKKLIYKFKKESWFIEAVEIYCDAVDHFFRVLFNLEIKSQGFLPFREIQNHNYK